VGVYIGYMSVNGWEWAEHLREERAYGSACPFL